MRIDRSPSRARPLAVALALAGGVGCAGPTASSDLARIRDLSRAPLPASAASDEVPAETAGDARPLLARPLDVDAAVRVALLNNRELRAKLREVGIARGELAQAGVLPNPEIEIGVTPPQHGHEHTHVELVVEVDLTSAILSPLRKRAAEAALEAARYRAAGAVVDLGYSVRAAFYAAQAAQQRLAIANRALDAFAASRDAARALFAAGNIPEVDAVTQDASYETARIAAAQIELEHLERRERLARLLGLSGAEVSFEIAGDVPGAPEQIAIPERPERRALSTSLELAEMRSRLEAAAGRAGWKRTEGWLPDMSVGVRGEREEDAWQVGAQLKLTLPLFDRQQGAVTAAAAEFDALLERYHALAIDVRSALREARSRLVSAHARARHYERAVIPAQKRVMAQMLLQYNAMHVSVFQLLEARRGQLDAELAHVETLRELWTAKAAFDALLSGRRVGSTDMAAPGMMGSQSAAESAAGGH